MSSLRLSLITAALFATGVQLLVPSRAEACPCITMVGTSIEEVAQRALVVVNDDSLDYLLQIAVEGDASELGWLVPTPAVPSDPVLVDVDFFDRLDHTTAPFLVGCEGGGGCAASDLTLRGQADNGVEVWSEGRIGALEFAVVSASDGSDLTAWLQARSFTLNSAVQSSVDDYVARGWAFVALRVAGDALVGEQPSLGPILIHVPYTGTPVFPLGMTALSTSERVGMLIFVAAAQPMKPANYPLVKIDGDELEADGEGGSNYAELLRRAIDAEGKGFMVQYVGDQPGMMFEAAALSGLLDGKKLVRLITDTPPGALDADLEFAVDASLDTPYYSCVPEAGTQDTGCAAAGQRLAPWLPLLVVAFGLLVLRRRRS